MVSIVIVNWNSGNHLANCVRSLLDYAKDFPITIVDNASTDGSLDLSANEKITLIRNDRNIGFAAACNIGWKSGSGAHILFLNPDTEAYPDSIYSLQQAFAADDSCWAVGGRLVNPSGRPGAYLRPFPSIWRVAKDMLFIDELSSMDRRRSSQFNNSTVPLEIDQPAAACLMVSRKALEKIDGFDEAFYPAWFEDVDLCRRIWDQGGRILYQPAARFLHHGGYSLNRLTHQAFLECFYGNQVRYFRKHHGRRAASSVKKLIVCGLLLRSAISLAHPLAADESRLRSAKSYWKAARRLMQSHGVTA